MQPQGKPMKMVIKISVMMLLLLFSQITLAITVVASKTGSEYPSTWLTGSEGLLDYKFFSRSGGNINQYTGDANINNVGLWQRIHKNTLLGVFYTHIYSYTSGQFTTQNLLSFFPFTFVVTNTSFTTQKVRTNSVSAVLLQRFFKIVVVGLFGSYGWDNYFLNQVSLFQFMGINEITNFGSTNFSGNTWTAGISTYLGYAFRYFRFEGTIRYFHIDVARPGYTLGNPTILGEGFIVLPLTINTDNFTEDLKVVLTATPYFQPFVNAGALQVFKRKLSRSLEADFSEDIAGSLPALLLGNNAYVLGAGVESDIKNFIFRFAYERLRRGKEYHSNLYSFRLLIPL